MLPLAFASPLLFLQAAPAAAPPPSPAPATTAAPAEATRRVVHLDDAQKAALEHQPQVLQARATTEAASGRAEQARAGFFPQVNATAQYQRIHGSYTRSGLTAAGAGTNVTTPAPSGAAGSTYDYWNFGVSASQTVWDFGQTYERSRAASRAVDASRASEKTTALGVLFNVRRAFFEARAQKSLIGVAQETLANLQRHMAQIQGFVAVGTRPEIDLAQARTDIANAKVSLIRAQNAYEIAKAQLDQAMGVPQSTDYDVADEEIGPIDGEDFAPDQLAVRAAENRPELVALEKQREAQELTVRSIKGAYGPTLSATAGAAASGPALDTLGPNWNVGALLNWPIFQGGLTNGQVREAEANLDVTRAQLDTERLQVRFEVEQAALTLHANKVAITAAQEALANARERLRLAEGRYESGVGSIIELSDAQLAVTNASAQVVQAQFDLATARAQLLTALGRP